MFNKRVINIYCVYVYVFVGVCVRAWACMRVCIARARARVCVGVCVCEWFTFVCFMIYILFSFLHHETLSKISYIWETRSLTRWMGTYLTGTPCSFWFLRKCYVMILSTGRNFFCSLTQYLRFFLYLSLPRTLSRSFQHRNLKYLTIWLWEEFWHKLFQKATRLQDWTLL
jgi:hypothetical protein